MPEAFVVEALHLAPGGCTDLFCLQFADSGRGAEEEAEVEVPVGGLALGGVGVDGVDVDVERNLAVRGDDVGRDAGLLGEFAAGGLRERLVRGLEVAAGQKPLPGRVVEDVQDTAVGADEDRAGRGVTGQGLAAGEVAAAVDQIEDGAEFALVPGCSSR